MKDDFRATASVALHVPAARLAQRPTGSGIPPHIKPTGKPRESGTVTNPFKPRPSQGGQDSSERV